MRLCVRCGNDNNNHYISCGIVVSSAVVKVLNDHNNSNIHCH